MKEEEKSLLTPCKNCECCGGSYQTGKNYGNGFCSISNMIFNEKKGVWITTKNETKGLCEFCNQNSPSFCCSKHGFSFKIGNITYRFKKIYKKNNLKKSL